MEDLVVIGWRYKKEGERSIVWRPEFKCKPKQKKYLRSHARRILESRQKYALLWKSWGKKPNRLNC